jgi:hypothetical protein
LELNENKIKRFWQKTFKELIKLEELYILRNKYFIENNKLDLMKDNSNLRCLYLSKFKIETIPSQVFSNMDHLNELGLELVSNFILNNHTLENARNIRFLHIKADESLLIMPNSFNCLLNLTELTLMSNICSHLFRLEWISNLVQLEYLELYGFNLDDLNLSILDNFLSLSSFVFKRNYISSIKNPSRNLSRLRAIQFSHNYIKNIDSLSFENANSLINLFINYNNFKSLPLGTFNSNASLNCLNLSYNELESIDFLAYSKLPSTNVILLNHNHITFMPSNSFQNIRTLVTLKLSHNNITELRQMAFQGKYIIN